MHRLEGLRYKKLGQMANVKTISLTELLICGILCRLCRICKTVSRIDLISSGKIRRSFTVFVRRFTEPETAVKLQFDSLANSIVFCVLRTGIEKLSKTEFPLRPRLHQC